MLLTARDCAIRALQIGGRIPYEEFIWSASQSCISFAEDVWKGGFTHHL